MRGRVVGQLPRIKLAGRNRVKVLPKKDKDGKRAKPKQRKSVA